MFRWYSHHLTHSPIVTNLLSGSSVLVAGDVIAQGIEKRRGLTRTLDPVRSAAIFSWAVMGDVPINLALFTLVDKVVSFLGIPARSSLPQSVLKAGLFFVPGAIIRNPGFILFVTPFEHVAHNVRDGRVLTQDWERCVAIVRRKLSEDLSDIITTAAGMWIPINSITFWKIPPAFRTIWTAGFTVIWMTYLSMVHHKPQEPSLLLS